LTRKEQKANIVAVQQHASTPRNETGFCGFNAQPRNDAMLAVLSTLAFAGTLWLIGVIALRMIDESGGKILAALKGQSPIATPQLAPVALRVGARARLVTQQRPVRAQLKRRAAA
jgi:hypothetical protein